MGKVMFITDSVLNERQFLDGIDRLYQANIDIISTILPTDCTPRELKACVTEAQADVIIIGSNQAKVLSGIVAAQTQKPVFGIHLKSGIIGARNALYGFKGLPVGKPLRIAEASDISFVISEAQKLAS